MPCAIFVALASLALGSFCCAQVFDITQPPFNAVPDDFEDDTPAIQDAFDAAVASEEGGVVYIPPGLFEYTHVTSTTLDADSKKRLLFEGQVSRAFYIRLRPPVSESTFEELQTS